MSAEIESETENLPSELRYLVRTTVSTLGEELKKVYGEVVYEVVESFRENLKELRGQTYGQKQEDIEKLFVDFQALDTKQMKQVTHAFASMMELINRCEKAYRTFRLASQEKIKKPEKELEVVYVFTAHPTEARSKNNIELLNRFERLCIQVLKHKGEFDSFASADLRHIVALLLRSPLSKSKAPTVRDEAIWLFDIILAPEILSRQIRQSRQNTKVRFRSWVGGDKDGHPYVDASSTRMSWTESRKRILSFIVTGLDRCEELLKLTGKDNWSGLFSDLKSLHKKASDLSAIRDEDGKKVEKFKEALSRFKKNYAKKVGEESPDLERLEVLFNLYPALVVPLEFREDSEVVRSALKKPDLAISQMLKTLKSVSKGSLAKNYVQGFVLSMVVSAEDHAAGIKLMKKHLGKNWIPLIPLFETRQALNDSTLIVQSILDAEKDYLEFAKSHWDSKFEVMLGYSDSSKENGVLLSRVLISKTIADLCQLISSTGLKAVFFHGSGGSVERGGGSISDQISGWPPDSLNIYKSTIQGEMISRNFGNPAIMERVVDKWLVESSKHQESWEKTDFEPMLDLAEKVSEQYRTLVASDWFRELVLKATPYQFLDQLKIGSRPSKRSKSNADFKMRAIPWVLCWTQTRSLLPVWWGLGYVWKQMNDSDKNQLVDTVNGSKLLRSYFNILGFTLAKVDLSVFDLYIKTSLEPSAYEFARDQFLSEHEAAVQLYEFVLKEAGLEGLQPWLSSSIRVRSPYIDLLNFAQIVAVKNEDMELLREATTGIACGMLTTG